MKKRHSKKQKRKYVSLFSMILSFIFHGIAFVCFSILFYLYFMNSYKTTKVVASRNLVEYKIEIDYQSKDKLDLPCKAKTYQKIQKEFQFINQKKVNDLLDEARDMAKKVQNKIEHLTKVAKVHDTMVSQKGQKEILSLLGEKFKNKDFIPSKTPIKGDFDWNDFTIFKIVKIFKPSGYMITFVDRSGRIIVKKYYGEDAKSFDNTYSAFSICGKSKVLKSLLDYTLKSIPTLLK